MFKSTIFKLVLILNFFFISISKSEIIKTIDINGNKRISDNTIFVLGDLAINDNYDEKKLDEILKKLFETNFFKDINLSLDKNRLIINVVENPIIENIEIRGIKSKEFTKFFYENMKLKDRMSYSENILTKDINLIKNILQTNGFYYSEVKITLNRDDDLNSVEIIIDIDQGEKTRIKKISFIGDKKIKSKKLREVIASEEYKFWKFITKNVYLDPSRMNLDIRLLENFYRNLGYKNVKIKNSFIEFDKKNNFHLIFNIESGELFYFNNIDLSLPSDYLESDFDELNKVFVKLKDKKYSLDNVNLILDQIEKIASLRLYDFIDAKIEETIIDDNKIDLKFNIVDSEKFYVEKVNIFGNFQTLEEVVRNRLIVDEGDPLNSLLFNKTLDNIKALRIFKDVKSEIKDGSDSNLKIIDITVEEQPTGEISLAAGAGTSGTTIGGGIKEKNFLGKGINLSTFLEVSEETIQGKFIYSKPNFAFSDNTLYTSIQSTSSDFLSDFGYKQKSNAFSLGTEFEQYENLFFSPEFLINFEKIETNSSASNQLKKQEGNYNDFYFNYGLNYDLRNSKYSPSSGTKTSFSQSLPVVSDNNELSNTFILTGYKELNKTSGMIGQASFYAKTINSLDNSDVRISKRAKIPYNRLRGFEKGKVGPIDNNDYIGGNYASTLNLQTNIPGIFTTVENLEFSYFVDIANIWGVDYDENIGDSSKLRSSTGLALDFLTPIGPLSFSLTQPLTKSRYDKTETFRFNLGTSF